MAINNQVFISSASPLITSKVQIKEKNDMFASVLAEAKEKISTSEFIEDKNTTGSIEQLIEEFREKGFKGLFKAIEEEKIKKLRQEILREMGFTEEKLSELSPEQRSAIEKIVSEEIQKRMALGTLSIS
ncbi:MAG: hypothetical protein ACQEQS_05380 [Thermodesulfobacteriota bacterium]